MRGTGRMRAGTRGTRGTRGWRFCFTSRRTCCRRGCTGCWEAELAAHTKQRKAPPELWHAVIFYCVGEVTRRRVPGYEPYADAQKLWQREWPGLLPVLDATFQEYIGGKGTLLAAVNGLVVGL